MCLRAAVFALRDAAHFGGRIASISSWAASDAVLNEMKSRVARCRHYAESEDSRGRVCSAGRNN